MNFWEVLVDKSIEIFKQPSTWKGICSLLMATGIITLNPQQIAAIVTFGLSLIGLIQIFWDKE